MKFKDVCQACNASGPDPVDDASVGVDGAEPKVDDGPGEEFGSQLHSNCHKREII